jgi:aminoglycoside phosphotransferase (APT) family kinase protein
MSAHYPPEVAPVRNGDELDWSALAVYLSSEIADLGSLEAVNQFPNGSANLTYRLDFARRQLVVRRPPFGDIAAGAHDMRREFRALSRLWRHYDRAPRAYLYCDDRSVIGADFLVIEYREGQVVWGQVPPNMSQYKDVARRIAFAVVDALAELHRVDPDAAGVADLGRPDGFADRQLAGWRRRWHSTTQAGEIPLLDDVADALAASRPASQGPAILHNDFKIDNCQFDPADPDRVISVFDWDMATVGDPLVDLGTLLNYWPDPSDTDDDRPMHPAGQERIGLPARAEIVKRYGEITGADISAIAWYEAFGCWKTAIVVAQLYDRYLQGKTQDQRQATKGARVLPLARRAGTILAGA